MPNPRAIAVVLLVIASLLLPMHQAVANADMASHDDHLTVGLDVEPGALPDASTGAGCGEHSGSVAPYDCPTCSMCVSALSHRSGSVAIPPNPAPTAGIVITLSRVPFREPRPPKPALA